MQPFNIITFATIAFFLIPNVGFSQRPNLGIANNFIIFTKSGAVSNTGTSSLCGGTIGTNIGQISGFGSNIPFQNANSMTSLCAADLVSAFNEIHNIAITNVISALPISGTFYAGANFIGTAANMGAEITLDAQNDSNALFIFNVAGALSAPAGVQIHLINGALASNVFWNVDGAINIAAGSTIKGNYIALAGAVTLGAGTSLNGRIFSIAGAMSINRTTISTCTSALAPVTALQMPDLGTAGNFILFTQVGTVSNSGISFLNGGIIGTNSGVFTGFELMNVSIQNANSTTAQCATDLITAFNFIHSMAITNTITTLPIGGTYNPGVYYIGSAASTGVEIILDAHNDTNALFVFNVAGALSFPAGVQIHLINGADWSHIFWNVDGAIDIGAGSDLMGTFIALAGAVNLGAGASINGRIFSIAGALSINTVGISACADAIAPPAGNVTICSGNTAALRAEGVETVGWYSAASGGVWLGGGNDFTTPPLYSTTTYYVQDSTCTASHTRTPVIVTVNPILVPAISVAASNSTIAAGNLVIFTATITNGGLAPICNFILNGTSVQNSSNQLYSSASLHHNDVLSCTLTANNTCQTGATVTSNSIPISVSGILSCTWTGAMSNDWFNVNNWLGGYHPIGSDSIIINTGTSIIDSDFTVLSAGSLTVSGTGSLVINAGNTLSVAAGGKIDFGGKSVILKSDANGTAALGKVDGSLIGASNVTVERYISGSRKWRLLSVPTEGQSFKEAWQEGASIAYGNPNPRNGFLIGGVGSNALSNGFDLQSGSSMVKSYDPITNNWVGISSTYNLMNAHSGYMCFIAGDRTAISSTTATTSRTTGTIKIGSQAPINVPVNSFMLVGNPYPSPLIITEINVSNLKKVFYVWDPNLAGGDYGLGGYQALSLNSSTHNYEVTPGGGSYGTNGSVVTNIESGQAFFIQGNSTGGAGSIQFEESDKGVGSGMVFFTPEAPQRLMCNLGVMRPDSSVLVTDGVLVRFNDNYSNSVTDEDILKMGNTNENLGLLSGGKTLAVENRNMVQSNDTLHLKLTGVRVQSYQWKLTLDNMDAPGRMAFLLDQYKQTSTPLNMAGISKLNFTIENISGSYASDRFKIVFTQQGVLTVSITSIDAIQNYDKSLGGVLWKISNEINLSHYDVERSLNGHSFTSIGRVVPKDNKGASTQYLYSEKNLIDGNIFYRIKAISNNGELQYSNIVKINASKEKGRMVVSPNPVQNHQLNISYSGVENGSYGLSIINSEGKTLCSSMIMINDDAGKQTISLGEFLSFGNYLLLITQPNGGMISKQFMVE